MKIHEPITNSLFSQKKKVCWCLLYLFENRLEQKIGRILTKVLMWIELKPWRPGARCFITRVFPPRSLRVFRLEQLDHDGMVLRSFCCSRHRILVGIEYKQSEDQQYEPGFMLKDRGKVLGKVEAPPIRDFNWHAIWPLLQSKLCSFKLGLYKGGDSRYSFRLVNVGKNYVCRVCFLSQHHPTSRYPPSHCCARWMQKWAAELLQAKVLQVLMMFFHVLSRFQ